MSLFNIFVVAGSAMTAQNQRLNVVASNLANADSATSSNGQPYKAKQVVFTSTTPMDGMGPNGPNGISSTHGVKVARVIENQSPMKMVYEPTHPMANPAGFVTMPNVNVVEEMVDMISASRSYQNNVDMMNTAKTLLLKTLTIGQ
ncbi:flagellar basal-body rod protein FlgC [Nitrosospira sp. Nsp2]|jgi:flagellar basal-body rod protein FlgC|uniref:flagellar basal body rod protein FlgC n=1 Tax=Nitrosospira sp. Nsp2 TaxID=136548 RepID=UPI000D3048F4|nr:flagellar basal body rod protein FlgC [Nitrosospira sp. Nsp2]PTR16434.1 flagellar basal-body rod protein FlgC [Nitrosospira sp. Nsp2]